MAYQLKEFVEASKFMDFTDKETYMTIGVVNESEQKEILLGITNKLYEKLKPKLQILTLVQFLHLKVILLK